MRCKVLMAVSILNLIACNQYQYFRETCYLYLQGQSKAGHIFAKTSVHTVISQNITVFFLWCSWRRMFWILFLNIHSYRFIETSLLLEICLCFFQLLSKCVLHMLLWESNTFCTFMI